MQSKPTPQDRPFTEGEIVGVVVKALQKHEDERGWLAEIFRHDQLNKEFYPVMAYVSMTEPGRTRGPHEHMAQADFFVFIGPSTFELRLWDNRPGSETYWNMMIIRASDVEPKAVLVPKRVVHAYRNVGDRPGLVVNCPNRLYKGEGYREPVDEIRHEDDPETIFRMDD